MPVLCDRCNEPEVDNSGPVEEWGDGWYHEWCWNEQRYGDPRPHYDH